MDAPKFNNPPNMNLFLPKIGRLFAILLAITILSSGNLIAQKQLKKRVAVFSFDDKTNRSFSWFDSKKSPGQGMADMLITELVQSGRYIVLERTEMSAIYKEQDIGDGRRVNDVGDTLDFFRALGGDMDAEERLTGRRGSAVTDESKAAKDKLLGAEIAIIASISEFGYKGGETGAITKKLGVGVKSQAAVVGLDLRLVNTSTGEILHAEKIRKEEKKRGLSIRSPKLGFSNKDQFDDSIVGKATRKAIENIVELVNEYSDQFEWKAKVVIMTGGNVVINAGSTSGVNVGDKFTINRAGEELIDPDTGLNLGSIESKIAEIEVIDNKIGDGKA